jgi:hypothetical protein
MRYALPAVAAILFAVAPAHATQGLLCRPASGKTPRLSLVIGAGGIVGASLDEKKGWVSTMAANGPLILTQGWIDGEQVLADIADRKWDRVARLQVRFQPLVRGQPRAATGTLVLRGRPYRIRCEEA